MHELSTYDIQLVSGGQRTYDWVPNAQSDWGNRLNDATNMLGNFGSTIGLLVWDWTH